MDGDTEGRWIYFFCFVSLLNKRLRAQEMQSSMVFVATLTFLIANDKILFTSDLPLVLLPANQKSSLPLDAIQNHFIIET